MRSTALAPRHSADTVADIIFVSLILTFAAIIQTSTGFGFALISLPLLALLIPQRLPVFLLVIGLPLSSAMAVRERRHIHGQGVLWMMLGRIFGIAPGIVIISALGDRSPQLFFGVVTLLSAAMLYVARDPLQLSKSSWLVSGTISSVMATSTGLGGPPFALLYSGRPGHEIRGTLATIFTLGNAASLLGLCITGHVRLMDVMLGLALAPTVLLGMYLGARVIPHLTTERIRLILLALVSIGGFFVLAKGMLG